MNFFLIFSILRALGFYKEGMLQSQMFVGFEDAE